MMEPALRTLIRTFVPGIAVDWGMNSSVADAPRVVLYTISGAQTYTTSDVVVLRERRVQADCYALTYGEAKTLARQVTNGIGGYRGGNFAGVFLVGDRDFSPDTDGGEVLFRTSLDFMIHHKET